jgi:regulator of ribonuclease activity A
MSTIATSINIKTTKTLVCDIMDVYSDKVRLLDPIFKDYGAKTSFYGSVTTIQCFEDNSRVLEAVEEPGNGRILIIDGGGSLQYSMLGGNFAKKAFANGWAGIIINGCLRDIAELKEIALGIKALGPCPRRCIRQNIGERDVTIRIAGQSIISGDYLYADQDGIVVASEKLHQ